jgi:hypothetical protein
LRDLFANFKESMDFFAKVPVEVREQGLHATRPGGALERSPVRANGGGPFKNFDWSLRTTCHKKINVLEMICPMKIM